MDVAFLTLGCKVNSYETEAMIRLFRDAGARITDFESTADVYIINTCTVTSIADKKSRQMLRRAKKRNPDALIVAVGCYAQEAGELLLSEGIADLVIGNNQKSKIVELTRKAIQGGEKTIPEPLDGSTEYEALWVSDINEKTRAYIKIQDGCNQFCAYCIIPYVRGRIRSRDPMEVRKEVEALAQKGYQEIVLTGIHLSSYGKTQPGSQLDGTELAQLIVSLSQIEKLKRIRLGSLEPRIITEKFVNIIKEIRKLCPHFHLSLQSGCDETLKRMNRKYSTDEYERAVSLLRTAFDRPAITTDVIVGFPGETESEFLATCKFVERIRFSKMHIFRYSIRKGTIAAQMKEQVPESVKNLRSDILTNLDEKMQKEYLEGFLEQQEEILTEDMEEINGRMYRIGHNTRYVRYATDAKNISENVLLNGKAEHMIDDKLLYFTPNML